MYDCLILDRLGQIVSCGAPAERMFRIRLVGPRISDSIAGLLQGRSSPSYFARYLLHLCEQNQWQIFNAMDAEGRGFSIEVNLSRMTHEGHEMFLVNLRRSNDIAGR